MITRLLTENNQYPAIIWPEKEEEGHTFWQQRTTTSLGSWRELISCGVGDKDGKPLLELKLQER